jgi:cell division septation protein DedD
MRHVRKALPVAIFAVLIGVFSNLNSFSANADSELLIRTAEEHIGGYDRSLFKHWIDADKNGCDTRKEVLIAEAIVKPKKGTKCVLTGGKWISAYDGKSYTRDAGLDIDHMVPLAEAWRSGAWAWTSKQRQDFANDLTDSRVLIAVTASANRSKGDQDVKTWLPAKNKCTYIEAWVAVKVRYSLTFDTGEFSVIQNYFTSCPITNVSVDVLPGYETIGNKVAPTPTPSPTATPTATATATPIPSLTATPTPSPTATATPTPTPTPTATPTPSPTATPSASPTLTTTQVATVSPGAFCSPAGAIGKSAAGVTYTCKTSPTDTRNRWRQ